MPPSEERTINLPIEQVSYIDALIASGAYATASGVVRAGLRALQERDAVEQWLRDEVVPVYDAMQADPSRGIPADEVAANLDALHAARLRTGGHGR